MNNLVCIFLLCIIIKSIVIQLNLKDENFISNKLRYQKIKQCFRENIEKFDLIFSWEPPTETICPSSVAKFLCDLGYNVQQCTPEYNFRSSNMAVNMPVIPKPEDTDSVNELVEWLGMFSLNINLNPSASNSYVNSYQCPEDIVNVSELHYIQWKGFFPTFQLQKIFKTIVQNLPSDNNLPWISFYVQGFYDSPVIWNLEEHQYYTNRDNGYILFLEPSKKYLLYKKICSKKKYKN